MCVTDWVGIDHVKSMESTYPTADWDEEKCREYDIKWNPTKFRKINTTYAFASTVPEIDRMCAFVNGLSMPNSLVSTSQLKGLSSYRYFVDNEDYGQSPLKSTLSKRIYCVYIYYKNPGPQGSQGYHCSVGLSPVSFLYLSVHYYYCC